MDDQQKKMLLVALATFAVTFFLTWLFFGNKKDEVADHHGPSRISGDLTFDALSPEEGDEGSIDFFVRAHNTGAVFEPATMFMNPNFSNGGQWVISELEDDVHYDVQAVLMIGGEEITKSQIATVTAPASDVSFNLTVTWSDLPEKSVDASQNKTIAGTLDISGYIPDNATYTIFTAPARDNSDLGLGEVDDPQFTLAVSDLVAEEENTWVWDQALAQVEYRIRAELYTESGEYIGTSDIESGTVPQDGVALKLQSQAVTEPVQTPISGKVVLNGGYKSDSTVVVQVRENGSDGFFDVDSFPAESNRNWVYAEAKTGVNYDVRAVLMRQGAEQAKSSQEQAKAPAKKINLTINTDFGLDDPVERPEIVSCEERDDGTYNATIRYFGVDSARAYWIRIGKEDNGGDRFNEIEKPDNYGENVEVTIRIDDDRYYYTDYAYSYCSDCDTKDSFSDFSSSLKFYCGDDPDDD